MDVEQGAVKGVIHHEHGAVVSYRDRRQAGALARHGEGDGVGALNQVPLAIGMELRQPDPIHVAGILFAVDGVDVGARAVGGEGGNAR